MEKTSRVDSRRAAQRRARRRLALVIPLLVVLLIAADWLAGGASRAWLRGTGTLSVVTVPAGATVAVDGERLGTTPLEARVTAGERVLHVSHPYHREVVERVRMQRGAAVERQLTLEPAFGSLHLASNPRGARVTLDGMVQEGGAPLRLDRVPAGMHRIELTLPGRATVRRDVEVLPDRTTEMAAELEPVPMGTLTVNVTPSDARIELPDHETPYSPGIELPAAEYLVRVTRGGYAPVERRMRVQPGDNVESVTLLRELGRLMVHARPEHARVTVREGGLVRDYVPDMRLPTGPIVVEARALGHRTVRRTVQLTPAGAELTLALAPIRVRPGEPLRDPLASGGMAPPLIGIPAGRFRMGHAEADASSSARPAHEVTIDQPFAIGAREVTREEWERFARATGREGPRVRHGREPETPQHPVTQIEWDDAVAYVEWLSRETGHVYRLPSEAEWEYAARAGEAGAYPGGDAAILCRYANVADRTAGRVYREWDVADCEDGFVRTAPVASLVPNAWSLHDVVGNVAEWTADCWHGSFEGAPVRGEAWIERHCHSRVVRGGSWDTPPAQAALWARSPASGAGDDRGFRIVREL